MIKNIMKIASNDALHTIKFEKYFNERSRKIASFIFGIIALVLFISTVVIKLSMFNLNTTGMFFVSTFLVFVSLIPGIDITNVSDLSVNLLPFTDYFHINLVRGMSYMNGVMIISLVSYVVIKLINIYIRSFHYRNQSLLERGKLFDRSFYVKEVFYGEKYGDLVLSFFKSKIGLNISKRAGITNQDIKNFLESRSNVIDYRNDKNLINIVSIEDLAIYITQDISVKEFLSDKSVKLSNFIDAATLTESLYNLEDNDKRFFGKKYLLNTKSIRESLILENSTYIKKYIQKLSLPNNYRSNNNLKIGLSRLEEKITSNEYSDVILVGDNEYSAYSLIVQFYKYIIFNYKDAKLKGNDVYVLNIEDLCIENADKESFEDALIGLFNELLFLRNSILVIPSFHTIMIHSRNIGFDLSHFLRKYSNKINFRVIAITSTHHYHSEVDNDQMIYNHFDEININNINKDFIYDLLSKDIREIEDENEVYFSIEALNRIISISESTFTCGVLIEKIKEILSEVVSYAVNNNITVIKQQDVEKMASIIPEIVIEKQSKEKEINLVNLVDNLKSSIYGQEYAISSIVNCIKKKNSEKEASNKPLSFIIFGPDNHLKIEMASILSKIISGRDNNIISINMEEYSDDDAARRLIGSRNGPIGVLLKELSSGSSKLIILNDFEKANPSVHDLFKKIINEGHAYDDDGIIIDFKDSIIVATSSAGTSDVHINLENGGLHDREFQSSVLNSIQEKGIIDSNIVSAFDERILLGAIGIEEYRNITKYLLNNLSRKLNNEGIILIVNDYLIDSVLKYGIDPSFGISPIKKAIKDIVEKRIRDKIINGEILKGNIIEFKQEEII